MSQASTATALHIEVERTREAKPRPGGELGFGRYFTDHMFRRDYREAEGWGSPRILPYGSLHLEPAACVFHYGQSMFEGMKAFRGRDGKVRLFRPERHCQRMMAGTARLCMPAIDPVELQQVVTELVRMDAEWVPSDPGTSLYIRPTFVATEPFLGVRAAREYALFVILCPVGAYYKEGVNPVRIWVERESVRAAKGGLGAVKAAANYAASLLAARQAQERGYSQVLWLDAARHELCEEMGVMNLFVVIGDTVITPPLEGTILGGITRGSVIDLLGEWGVQVEERALPLAELVAAHDDGSLREVFGTGTAAVISPVGELGLDERRLSVGDGRMGALSRRLYDEITGIQCGRIPDRHGWLVDVG